MKQLIFFTIAMWYSLTADTTFALGNSHDQAFTRQDTLRGSNGSGRSWWDVQHYALHISFDTATKSISGTNKITARIIAAPADSLQLDLQELMFLDSIVVDGRQLSFVKDGNVWWVKHPFTKLRIGEVFSITAFYHGKPRVAVKPPWDGGFIWTKDSTGNPWIAVACQGLGASSWWPCKDYQGDEPDSGTTLTLDYPSSFQSASNGALISVQQRRSNTVSASKEDAVSEMKATYTTSSWRASMPVNTYNVTFYLGDYISWTDTLMGEKGKLDLSFYALRHNESRARKQFAVTKEMLHCFEYWMGPYPFYEDGYKLVEAPYLGMEHQSAVAYGNQYKMGYLGFDRSGTGVGLLFDFIIVHESGHEWFGNNITAQDIADNWLHEGLTTYTETLFTECAFGREKAFAYARGQWKGIQNDKPVIGAYGVNNEGSADEYDKGAAVIHMIRSIMNDDEKFRQLLRALNRDFYHKIVTSREVEAYISRFTGYDFQPLFDQYLRTADIPEFEYYIKKKQLFFRFRNVVAGFTLPLEIIADGQPMMIHPTADWQQVKWKRGYSIEVSKDFLIRR